MTLLRWDPLDDLYTLRREMARRMGESWVPSRVT